MTGTRLTIRLQDTNLNLALREDLDKLASPEPLLKSIGEEMLPRVQSRFKSETGPDGKRWTPLSPRTIEARLKKYGNAPMTILRMRGHLSGSINYQTKASSLSIGTGDEVNDYAAIHQFGGKAGRGRKVKIPARPYLGFSDDDMDVIEDEVFHFLNL